MIHVRYLTAPGEFLVFFGVTWSLGLVPVDVEGIVIIILATWQFVELPPRAQPRFQSWGSNSLVLVIVQNKIRMVYRVSCTAVCYVTVIALFIKKLGWSVQILGVRTRTTQWLRP